MKTISGQCASMKEISLSKAAKILSKFVSADNGASQIINAYLHRASASFNELDQLHKELKLSRSHKKKKKHKKHGMETGDEENFAQIVETNQELSHGNVKSKNDFRRQGIGSENADEDDKKSTQNVVKVSQELNGSIGYQTGNLGGNEKKHKKNKKNKQEDESRLDVDREVPTRAHNEILSGQEKDNEGDINPGMEEGKKHKKEKKKKKHKEGTGSFSINKGEVENLEGEVAKGQEQNKVEKRLTISVEGENGGLVGSDNLRGRKKKKYEAGSEDKLHAEELKMEQKKKRKYEVVEGRLEDKSGDLTKTKKRMKRKHEGDP